MRQRSQRTAAVGLAWLGKLVGGGRLALAPFPLQSGVLREAGLPLTDTTGKMLIGSERWRTFLRSRTADFRRIARDPRMRTAA